MITYPRYNASTLYRALASMETREYTHPRRFSVPYSTVNRFLRVRGVNPLVSVERISGLEAKMAGESTNRTSALICRGPSSGRIGFKTNPDEAPVETPKRRKPCF